MNKKFAFTLAETLITLGIIGVVSALTIPTLVSNYQKSANTVHLRKAVTSLSSAIDLMTTMEEKTKVTQTSLWKDGGIDNFFTTYIKTTKKCVSGDKCFGASYTSVDGSKSKTFTCGGSAYMLADGTAICMTALSGKDGEDDYNYFEVNIDINAGSIPNVGGKDMFTFYINKLSQGSEITIGDVQPRTNKDSDITASCVSNALGQKCLTAIQEAGWKMQY